MKYPLLCGLALCFALSGALYSCNTPVNPDDWEWPEPPADSTEISAKMNDFNSRRREKQPLNYPSAGSTFKRPDGYFAAKLIEDAGLKGASVGGAVVSEKHAGFVVNTGGATSKDIIDLTDMIAKKVYELYGVKLELEVKKLGF